MSCSSRVPRASLLVGAAVESVRSPGALLVECASVTAWRRGTSMRPRPNSSPPTASGAGALCVGARFVVRWVGHSPSPSPAKSSPCALPSLAFATVRSRRKSVLPRLFRDLLPPTPPPPSLLPRWTSVIEWLSVEKASRGVAASPPSFPLLPPPAASIPRALPSLAIASE